MWRLVLLILKSRYYQAYDFAAMDAQEFKNITLPITVW